MILIEDGRISLHDAVGVWLPELAEPRVVRTPASPLDDLVPAIRPINVFDLLTSRAGYGFPSDFTLPAVQRLFEVQKDGREPQNFLPQDAWMAALSEIPMLYQPGDAWLYDTCSVLQGVLISRVSRPIAAGIPRGPDIPTAGNGRYRIHRAGRQVGTADELLPNRCDRSLGARRRTRWPVEHAATVPAGQRRPRRNRR